MNIKWINPNKIKTLSIAFGVVISSMAILTGCNHTPTDTVSPNLSEMTQATKLKKAETTLKSIYTNQVGLPLESVTCPADANFDTESTFDCQAKAQGVTFWIQVESKAGDFDSKIKGQLINLSKVEALIETTFKEKSNLEVSADCGSKRRVAQVGDVFTCKVTDKQGQVRKAQITLKDNQGNFNVKI